VVQCWTCDREVLGSNPAVGCCVPMPTERAIPPGLVNEYQRTLGSKQAHYAMHWPHICGLAASADGVRLKAKETEISTTPWVLRLGKGLYLLLLISQPQSMLESHVTELNSSKFRPMFSPDVKQLFQTLFIYSPCTLCSRYCYC